MCGCCVVCVMCCDGDVCVVWELFDVIYLFVFDFDDFECEVVYMML